MDRFYLKFGSNEYKDAFVDFAEGKNNTIDDFNDLIDGFKDGTNGGSTYDHYEQSHVSSWDDILWDDLSKK